MSATPDTPRTDAEVEDPAEMSDGTYENLYDSMTSLARSLERELTAKSAEIKALRELLLQAESAMNDTVDALEPFTLASAVDGCDAPNYDEVIESLNALSGAIKKALQT